MPDSRAPVDQNAKSAGAQKEALASDAGSASASGGAGEESEAELFPGANSGDGTVQLSPEKLLQVFDRVSNLKSDARKYAVAYRLVNQLGLDQMEQALEIALSDLKDHSDYTTTRAVARRWADMDPKAIVSKGLESKNFHIIQPAMETWVKTDQKEPLKWALQQAPDAQAIALKQLLEFRSDFKGKQVEQMVIAAAESPHESIRNTILPLATSRMAEENPVGALHVVEQLPQSASRQQMISNLLIRVGKTQPEVAVKWLSSQTILTPAERQNYEKILRIPAAAASGIRK